MAMKFVDYDSASILNLFNSEYLKKMKVPMIIGSEEYVLSSIFSYALSVLVNSMNKSELNRFIDTAEGLYLDAIASSFNLSRVNNAPSNAKVDVKVNTGTAPVQISLAGITFARGTNKGRYYQYVANEPLQKISPTIDELTTELHEAHANIDAYSEIYPKGYFADEDGNPISFPYTREGDNSFREFIKSHNALTKGTAIYFEQLVKASHSNLRDAYTIRPNELGYESGTVSVLLLPHKDEPFDYDNLIIDEILEVLRNPENHSLGQDTFDVRVCATYSGPNRYYNLAYGSKYNKTVIINDEQKNLAQLHASVIKAFYADKIYKINTPYSDIEFINLLSSNVTQNTELTEFVVKKYGQSTFDAIAEVKADGISRVNSSGTSVANEIVFPPINSYVYDCSDSITTYVTFRY